MIRVVAFDADDTLWHNEDLFIHTRDQFVELLADYQSAEVIERRLYDTEMRNLRHFGYGIKGFVLSMIETALELTEHRINGTDVGRIINLGKAMLDAPVRLLPGARDVLQATGESYHTAVITKGDLFDQETKLARSGLGEGIQTVEIVSDKTVDTYRAVLERMGVAPQEFVMIGNSMRSDVVPVAELGGHAVFVPYASEWEHESVADTDVEGLRFHTIHTLDDVPALLESLNAADVSRS